MKDEKGNEITFVPVPGKPFCFQAFKNGVPWNIAETIVEEAEKGNIGKNKPLK